MKRRVNRRTVIGGMAAAAVTAAVDGPARAQSVPPKPGKGGGGRRGGGDEYVLPAELAAFSVLSLVLGRVTDRSVTVSALSKEAGEGYLEFGTETGKYTRRTAALTFNPGEPIETVIADLQPNTEYFYRLQFRKPSVTAYAARPEGRFHTQRAAGSTFTFAVQGDSHPERPFMSEPNLYARTLRLAAATKPDFYVCMGDDFSVEKVRDMTADGFAQPYLLQRPFLGLVGHAAPLFLLNGNHEQASMFNYNQADVRHDAAVFAQLARNKYYPTLAPDGFYSGDAEELKSIGPLKDYYAWTWGDALFVVLDNYWHSPALVDSGFQEKGPDQKGGGGKGKGGKGDRDWWDLTLGDAQYQWFKRTLEQSKAKYKFVFAHHVLGSGRGGVDECHLYEWGGKNKRGEDEFKQRRPNWAMPVHQLMVKHGVTIFFQGHDHLYCQQQRDGVVYQEVPMPADHGYVCYNEDRYGSGVKLPNSGFLKVTVSPERVKVEYVRTYLPKDETDARKTGEVAHAYEVTARSKDV